MLTDDARCSCCFCMMTYTIWIWKNIKKENNTSSKLLSYFFFKMTSRLVYHQVPRLYLGARLLQSRIKLSLHFKHLPSILPSQECKTATIIRLIRNMLTSIVANIKKILRAVNISTQSETAFPSLGVFSHKIDGVALWRILRPVSRAPRGSIYTLNSSNTEITKHVQCSADCNLS